MPVSTKSDPDWSDSDEEDERSDVETSVLLGIPDGEIGKQEDIDDAAVSRIGGHPAFLTSTEPPISSSQCKNCSFPTELLVQLWCPFESSPMDRALYVFGCGRGECQQKPGSVRVFRGLRYNTAYAAKLEKKLARQREKEAARLRAKQDEETRKTAAKVNPFSLNSNSATPGGLFGAPPTFGGGLGSQLFGASDREPKDQNNDDDDAPPPPESESESESEAGDSEPGPESDSGKSVLAAPAHTPSSSSPWLAVPAYSPPLYLSTASEYVPPVPKPKLPISISSAEAALDEDDCSGMGKSKKAETRRAEKEKEEAKAWNAAMEGYEDSLEVDKVFERFARVAGYEGEQCIRYELGGTPLPYANDSIFKSLFPSPTSTSSISSSEKFTPATTSAPGHRTYDPKASIISPCVRCGSPRTFECQLMPHLISVLQSQKSTQASSKDEQDPEARKRELGRLLRPASSSDTPGSGGGEDKRGMEWGTCMVFSCAKDCCLNDSPNAEKGKGKKEGKEAKELWTEELVLVQWDE